MVSPSCSCFEGTQFRRAATLAFQFTGVDQRPISAAIHEPGRDTVPLHFRELKMSSLYFKGHCFVAKHQVPHTAPIASYSVQLSLGTMDGHPVGAVSKGFQIAP